MSQVEEKMSNLKWNAAKDFSYLCVLNRMYIQGEISDSPYQSGPFDDSAAFSIEGLLKLHNYQLLVEFSQKSERPSPNNSCGKWEQYETLPFIVFTIDKIEMQYQKLFEILQQRSDIAVWATRVYQSQILSGSGEKVVVGRTRTATRYEKLEHEAWKPMEHGLTNENLSEYPLFCIAAMKKVDPVCFHVAGKDWGVSLDLPGIIESAAIECNLPKVSQRLIDEMKIELQKKEQKQSTKNRDFSPKNQSQLVSPHLDPQPGNDPIALKLIRCLMKTCRSWVNMSKEKNS